MLNFFQRIIESGANLRARKYTHTVRYLYIIKLVARGLAAATIDIASFEKSPTHKLYHTPILG